MNTSYRTRRLGFIKLAVLVTLFLPFLCTHEVEATSKDTVLQKAAAYGLYQCYKNHALYPEMSLNDYSSTTTVIQNPDGYNLYLPTGYTGNTSLINCQQILSGTYNKDFKGLYSMKGGVPPDTSASPETKGSFLAGMGYTAQASGGGSGEKCSTVSYNYTKHGGTYGSDVIKSGQVQTRICAPAGGTTIGSNTLTITTIGAGDFPTGQTGAYGMPVTVTIPAAISYETGDGYIKLKKPGFNSSWQEFTFDQNTNWHNFIHNDIWNYLSSGNTNGYNSANNVSYTLDTSGFSDDGNATSTSASYELQSYGTAASAAISYLTNGAIANASATRFNEEDKAVLLQGYLEDYYGVSNKGCDLTGDTASAAVNQGYTKARIYTDGGFKECYVKPTKNEDKSVRIYDSDGLFSGNTTATFQQVVEQAGSLSVTTLPGDSGLSGTPSGSSNPSDPSGETETSETPLCTQASGVLSWFFCPVLDFVGNTVGKIYEWIEDSFLAIPASLMTAGGDNGTYGGWKQFRDFANILFAILFAVVILSQITGIGISNYNIKKMLPRLIMVVVLVNVSFILCQLAVDLSNIVGHGLNTMLRGFASDPFKLGAAAELTNQLVSGTEAGVTGALGGFAGGLIITGIGLATIRLWILPLFLALVSALVAVAFFFLILGVRQAGIILLVVLAPMAIVCYALPNTKSLFDKWWKVFSALLMVYPICGAMMGGGTFAASILIDNDPDNFFSLIIAMLLTIVPFFFVPTILKNSLNGIAMLGNKLSTLGSQAGRGASKGIERSHGFQDAQQQMQFSRARASLKRQTALRGIGSSLAKTRAGKAVAGAAGAISQYGDRHKILGAGIRGVRGIGQAAADASQRKYLRNAKTAALSDRQQYEANNADAYLTGEVSRQRATDISNAKARYLDPKNSPIDTGDFASMQQEYEKQLDALLADPEDDSAIANVAALQDILSATDDGAAVMMSTLATKADQHSGTEDGRKALRKAATNIDAGAFKGRNRNYYKMATDFANGNFSQVGNGLGTYDSGVKDKNGNKLPPLSYLRGYHDSPAGLKYSAANFGSLDNSAYRQILNGIQGGEITGTNLQNLMETVNEAVSNDNIHLDNNAASYAQQILSAGYAQTAQPTAGGGTSGSGGTGTPSVARTYGSQAIAHAASAKSINNLTRSVQLGLKDDGTGQMVPVEGGIGTDDAVKIANNMLTAVRDNSNSFTQDQLDAMKSYVSAVNQRGTDSSGQPINFDTREFDSAQINVHGGKAVPTSAPAPVPAPSSSTTTSVRPGAVPGTQIIQTPGPNGSTTTQVRGWSGQPIGGSNTVTTNGGIILTGDTADQWRRNNQGGNGSGGPATP